MDIGNSIKKLRIDRELSREDLAKNIGYGASIIRYWENNEKTPNALAVIALADFFNVSTDYLLNREEEDGRIIVQELELPSDEKKVLEKYRILPPELKAVTYEYIKSLGNLNEEFNNKRKRNL